VDGEAIVNHQFGGARFQTQGFKPWIQCKSSPRLFEYREPRKAGAIKLYYPTFGSARQRPFLRIEESGQIPFHVNTLRACGQGRSGLGEEAMQKNTSSMNRFPAGGGWQGLGRR
jgi:hypothetical protein